MKQYRFLIRAFLTCFALIQAGVLPTTQGCSASSELCGRYFLSAPVDFVVNVTGPVDPATLDASDLAVNGIPASVFTLSNNNTTITFRFDVSPVHVGGNGMHIPVGAFNCSDGPVTEFICDFRYFVHRYRPTPAPRPAPQNT